jgi:hypothetical protein
MTAAGASQEYQVDVTVTLGNVDPPLLAQLRAQVGKRCELASLNGIVTSVLIAADPQTALTTKSRRRTSVGNLIR